MRIELYLKNEEETNIHSFYDMESNPFHKNDIISLSVSYPEANDDVPLYDFKIKEYKENRNLFNLKKIKLVDEHFYIPRQRKHRSL